MKKDCKYAAFLDFTFTILTSGNRIGHVSWGLFQTVSVTYSSWFLSYLFLLNGGISLTELKVPEHYPDHPALCQELRGFLLTACPSSTLFLLGSAPNSTSISSFPEVWNFYGERICSSSPEETQVVIWTSYFSPDFQIFHNR